MMPPYSCAVPGRKPGTSSNVTIGMLNASQKRTKRAALIDASMSSTPASTGGWLATMPTGAPASRAKPDHDVLRAVGLHLEELAVVDDALEDRSFMSYGLFVLSGTIVSSDFSQAVGGSSWSVGSADRRGCSAAGS